MAVADIACVTLTESFEYGYGEPLKVFGKKYK
jgi:hypothetical protein